MPDSQPARTDAESTEVEVVLRRLRQLGWALLITAVVVDAGEIRIRRVRNRLRMIPIRLSDAIEPRASSIATVAQAFLDASTRPR